MAQRMKRFLIVAFVAFCGISCSKPSEQTFFSCILRDKSNQAHQYSFEFNATKPYLFWVEGTQELKVVRNTPSQLWGEHPAKYQQFPYDQTSFQLNRVTGDAEVFYSRKPTAEEMESCSKDPGWGCDSYLVLTEHSEAGNCQVRERKI